MDKYEFNIKVEQIKKLVNKGDYETAMKIADTIDWRRVRSANLLALIAEIYENNEEYQEAKEVLLLAFERAPIGKRLLYKLADLALKENNLREAEDYYREFCDLAPEDPRQHLLRYQILKAKHAPDEQLIHSLERYTNTELDEKWLYELAELYCRAGKEEECIQTCDKIMLMFGLGKFVDKAMQLKVQYAPLSSYQRDLVENRDKYEEKLRAVEQQFGDETREIMGEDYENGGRIPETPAEGQPQEEMYDSPESGEESYPDQETPLRKYSKPHPEMERMPETEPVVIIDEPAMAAEPAGEMEIQTEGRDNSYQTTEEELRARIHQEETEKRLAREMSRISIEEYREPGSPMEQTKIIGSIREVLSAYAPGKEHVGQQSQGVWASGRADNGGRAHMIMPEEKPVGREEVMRRAAEVNYLMIETRTPEKGLELAVEVLKRLHKEKGTKCPVVKISGSKLSRKGVMESSDKLADKDLIIEEAGDLTVVALIELEDLIENSEIRVIMIDNPRQIESMARVNPALGSLFTVISLKEDGDLEIRRPEPVVRLEQEKIRMAEVPVQEVPVRTVYETVPQYAVETPVVEETVKLEERPDETLKTAIEEPTISVEEPAVESEDTKTAAMAEFMKLMESVIDTEPVVKKPDAEDPGDNTAAVMAEFMRLMENVAEDPSVMAEAERMEAEKLASEKLTSEKSIEETIEETPIEEKLAEEPQAEATVAEEPETPFAGAETEVTVAPVTPVTPLMQTIQPESPMAAAMAAATAVPAGMAGVPVMPVMVESPVTATVTSSSAVPVGVTGIPVTPIIMQSIPQPANNTASLRSDEEMELHDFVEYTCKYASDIDCSITGKSMLALYERIEVMEENGVPLTKINAENLIEEAADKAEKFSFKKLFTGLFHPRYDKEGLLILREEHFMD